MSHSQKLQRLLGGALLLGAASLVSLLNPTALPSQSRIPLHAPETIARCLHLHTPAGPPSDFALRSKSDRFVQGTAPVLFKNATIWTGGANGHEVVQGDLLLNHGMIQQVGNVVLTKSLVNLVEYDASGAWVSPGIFDLHSHMGVASLPVLAGAMDVDSINVPIQPWLRSIDGLNTHDDSFTSVVSGGVTTGLILPGSANAIGGQAFVIKYRPTKEKSPSSMLLEPSHIMFNETEQENTPPRWRHMKHACGETPGNEYAQTRMDTQWQLREAYNSARQIKDKQDRYCAAALAGKWSGLDEFPDELQWEALVDVLRGRVKIHNHCYEAVDLDGMVRLTNEFKFPIAAFHHAHETYLVPDLLKRAYGGAPAVALFATAARYKREAYRGSEFAPKILAENGIRVVMKSDHPLLNSRHLLHEAQQAHYFGLPAHLALASVTSTPASVAGLDHRVGFIRSGYDADIVLWDSHPLALGATPRQVFIDGIPQLNVSSLPHLPKPAALQRTPKMPNFEEESKQAVQWDGLPPLGPQETTRRTVVFTNITALFLKQSGRIVPQDIGDGGVIVVRGGKIACAGFCDGFSDNSETQYVDLEGGSIAPGFLSFGSALGLDHITAEDSTRDGASPDPLPAILGPDAMIRAVDGLLFDSRDMMLAYRSGVTAAVTAPQARSPIIAGLSTVLSTGARHKLEVGAILQEVSALHVHMSLGADMSMSTQVAVLRKLLMDGAGSFADVIAGVLPLVIAVDSADVMATLIALKREIGGKLRMTFVGGSEAHLVAKDIAEADIGVILIPAMSFSIAWEGKRYMPGPPLSADTLLGHLLAHNISVGLGAWDKSVARNTRFDVGWAALNTLQRLPTEKAIALVTTTLERLLGVREESDELVATRGGTLLDFEAKVVGVISRRKKGVDLF